MKKTVLFLFLITALTFAGCSNDDDTPDTPKQETFSVQLADNATFGKILTDGEGKSLYFFSNDSKDNSECSGGCKDNWPIFYDENPNLGTGLSASDFSTITREDGEKQTVYKGWPLYYFKNDKEAGQTSGDKVGEVWFIAKPDYSLMYVNAQLVGHDGKNYLGDYTEGDGNTKYITDFSGRTIYAFINDTKNKNNYTADDFSNNDLWPVLELNVENIPSILDASDFGTIDVFGRTQVTYKGWPLYYFEQDTERGHNKGISFPSAGAWPIVNTDTESAPEA